MPILITDYQWCEDLVSLQIDVPIKHISKQSVDCLLSKSYIKVNVSPYYCEIFLHAPIVEDLSSVTYGKEKVDGSTVINITLQKETAQLWNILQSIDLRDKELLKSRREEALRDVSERHERSKKEKSELKVQLDRYSVEQQMTKDKEERERIKNEKEAEKQKVLHKIGITTQPNVEQGKIHQEITHQSKGKKETNVPGIREASTIKVNFTPWALPTPTRESTVEYEKQFTENERKKQDRQREVEKMCEEEEGGEPRSMSNFDVLMKKARRLFDAKNFEEAIEVYTLALSCDSKQGQLYLERAKSYLKLNKLSQSFNDLSKILDVFKCEGKEKPPLLYEAHVLRGDIYREKELYVEALEDYESACKIVSGERSSDEFDSLHDLDVKREKVRAIIQGTVAPADPTSDDEECEIIV